MICNHGILPSHDTAERNGSFRILNAEHGRIQRMFYAV